MTITDNLRRMRQTMARVIPHADTFTALIVGEPTEDEAGNPEPGDTSASDAVPCKAFRMQAEDVVKAGMDSSRETWRVVTNAALPRVTTSDTLTVTTSAGQVIHLSVRHVGGDQVQVITGEVVT